MSCDLELREWIDPNEADDRKNEHEKARILRESSPSQRSESLSLAMDLCVLM